VNQLTLAPVHHDDPDSSREAAERVTPKVGTQLAAVLDAFSSSSGQAGQAGFVMTMPGLLFAWALSNREIQLVVCGGHNPGHPMWNKIATRTRTLERMGLIELIVDIDGKPLLREHRDGGRFLLWRVT